MCRWVLGATRGVVTMLAFLIFFAPQVEAAWKAPNFDFGGFVGESYFDKARGLSGRNYGGRIAYYFVPRFGIEGEFVYSKAEAPNRGVDQKFWWPHVDVVVPLATGKFQPFIKGGVGNASFQPDVSGADTFHRFASDAGGGIKWWFNERVAIRSDIIWMWTSNNNLELINGGPDRIQDYFWNAGIQIGFGGGEGDFDGDGVPDDIDDCPATPVGVQVDVRGCAIDSDGDLVPDYKDNCPDTPAGADVDAAGCPVDTDGDGVYDGIDQCPNTPAGATVDDKGCPVDTDGDNVFDGIDQCPNTPAGVQVDSTGCPVAEKIVAPLTLHGIQFESSKAEILPSSFAVLDEVATSLRAHPEVRLEVRGYADSSGPADFNLRLTQQRADSVRSYLVSRGITPSRLTAKGFGEADPISSNDTKEGRAQNRRVEFHPID